MLTHMQDSELVRHVRTHAGLSVRSLAEAACVAASTVHRIERGQLKPTVDTLRHLVEAAGMRLRVEPYPDYAASLVGLARSIREDLPADNSSMPVRRAAELVHRFESGDTEARHRIVTAEPPPTGDRRWDAFLGGLAEWLTVRAGMPTPKWSWGNGRYLDHGWWISPMTSMRAWEYTGTPASFQLRGVYVHRDSLTNV